MSDATERVIALADGALSSIQIGLAVGMSARYVRRILQRHNLPRLTPGAQAGSGNHQFVSGRRVDPDGYVLVTAPSDHPYARKRTGRDTKLIFEHRLVLEDALGRYLLPTEIVDHIDGLTLHNSPENLRLFDSNGQHLASTTTDRPKLWSDEGRQNIGVRTDLGAAIQRIDTYGRRRKSGDVRLLQILLAALRLGIDSPFLLGTHHHTRKAGIDMSSRSTIERALGDLFSRWGVDRTRLEQVFLQQRTLQDRVCPE